MSFRPLDKYVVVSTTHTASAGEIIGANATSAGFTINLPAAAANANKTITIKKTDSTFNTVTLDGNASETIDGSATRTLNTIYETYKIISDGSNWHVVEHKTDTGWITYTTTVGVASGTAPSLSSQTMKWKRDGDDILIRGSFTFSNATTWSQLNFSMPTGLTIDGYGSEADTGTWNAMDAGVANYGIGVVIQASANVFFLRTLKDDGSTRLAAQDTTNTSPFTMGSGDSININDVRSKVVGWTAP